MQRNGLNFDLNPNDDDDDGDECSARSAEKKNMTQAMHIQYHSESVVLMVSIYHSIYYYYFCSQYFVH